MRVVFIVDGYYILLIDFSFSFEYYNTESAAAAAQPGGPTLQSRVRPLSNSRVRLRNHNPLLFPLVLCPVIMEKGIR